MSGKRKKLGNRLPVFLLITFIVLAFLSFYLFIKSREKSKDLEKVAVDGLAEDDYAWTEYVNEKYGYSVEYPKFLFKEELENEGGYLSFVKFTETEFTQAKGMGVGVRKDSLENEVERLKSDLGREFNVKLTNEKNIKVGGQKAVILEYEPAADEKLIAKNLIIVANGDFVYSISTVPAQTGRIIGSFKVF